MKKFHTVNVKTYPHKSLNISKGVVRSKELSLCTIDEIKKEMKKQGVTEVKRVTIKKEGKLIETNTYIMTFDQPKIPVRIKVGYTMERVEQFIPNPLRCYNCQKYGHHEDNCRGRQVCGKCAQQDPDHHIDNYDNPYKCANCRGDHPIYARSCESWKLEKEILGIKHRNNIPFNEARKIIVGSKTTTYSQAIQCNKTQYNYEGIVKKLIQLEPGDWEGYINEIRASLDTNKISETPTTKADLVADKMKTPPHSQTSTVKTDQEKSMELSPTTQPTKCVMEKSPSKTRPKDRRSPIRPPNSTDTSPNKKLQKDKTKITPKQNENVDASNKCKILEKMEIENSPKVHKHKGHKNKRSNSPDLRPYNEPQNNPVELPRNQSQ